MTSAVRIRPSMDAVESQLGDIPIAQIDLGGVPRGAVLVLAGGGDFPSDAAQSLNALAAHGYEGVAADLDAIDGPDDQLVEAVGALLDHIGRRDWQAEQIGLIGYGTGGRIALLASSRFGLGAAVSVSPTAMTSDDQHLSPFISRLASAVRTPWLGMLGADDPAVPATACDELDTALRAGSPVYTQLVRYPGVGNHFYRPSSESLEVAASYDHWQRTIEWLNLRVQPRLTPLAIAWNERKAAS